MARADLDVFEDALCDTVKAAGWIDGFEAAPIACAGEVSYRLSWL